jgi:ubiquitin-conjugating enzyme E2 M
MYSVTAGSLAARRRAKKEEQKDEAAAASEDASSSSSSSASSSSSSPASGPKTTPALLRIQKDLADLEIPDNVVLVKQDDMNFSFTITASSGYWKGGVFEFSFSFPDKYPFQGPKVSCLDRIYHPNIDLEGGVCVNVLRPWKPTYSTQIVLFGLLFLFTHPNPNDPLNQEAAREMRESPQQFARNAVNAMKGLRVNNVQFPKNRGKGF